MSWWRRLWAWLRLPRQARKRIRNLERFGMHMIAANLRHSYDGDIEGYKRRRDAALERHDAG